MKALLGILIGKSQGKKLSSESCDNRRNFNTKGPLCADSIAAVTPFPKIMNVLPPTVVITSTTRASDMKNKTRKAVAFCLEFFGCLLRFLLEVKGDSHISSQTQKGSHSNSRNNNPIVTEKRGCQDYLQFFLKT